MLPEFAPRKCFRSLQIIIANGEAERYLWIHGLPLMHCLCFGYRCISVFASLRNTIRSSWNDVALGLAMTLLQETERAIDQTIVVVLCGGQPRFSNTCGGLANGRKTKSVEAYARRECNCLQPRNTADQGEP